MTDVIDVDESEATDISTPLLTGPRRRRRQRRCTNDERADDEREEQDTVRAGFDAHAAAQEEVEAEVGHPEHDELATPGGLPFGLFGPEPEPVDIPEDEGLDWQVDKIAKWTGPAFAVGFFAGLHLAPGGVQHTRPTFEVLDAARRARGNSSLVYCGLVSLGASTAAGVVVGVLLDRFVGLAIWLFMHFATPRRFFQAFAIAWCYSLRAFGTTRRFALWNAVSSLCICRDAPLGLRVAAVFYERRYLVAPYLWGPTSLATDWATESYWGFGISLIIVAASAALSYSEALVQWATGGRDPMMLMMNNESLPYSKMCVMTFMMVSTTIIPANPPLVCLFCTLGPSWLASRLSPRLGLAVFLALRASELIATCPALLTVAVELIYGGRFPGRVSLLHALYGQGLRSAWIRTDHLGLLFESADKRRVRHAFWKRYRRATRIEAGKSVKRQHRVTVEAMIHDEGLLEELPDDLHGLILGFLYKPTAADKRDERSYERFRRRPRNSHAMEPFDPFENGPGAGFLGIMGMMGAASMMGGMGRRGGMMGGAP